jgi:DNA-binding beta-propeller fold protein YncE
MARSFTSTGNIVVARFVKMSGDFTVAACGANERAIGVSQMGARTNSLFDSTDPPYAAISGEQVQVYQADDPEGNVALVELGGTVVAGDFIKSGSAGVAVKVTETVAGTADAGQNIVARALEGGASGTKIHVTLLAAQA